MFNLYEITGILFCLPQKKVGHACPSVQAGITQIFTDEYKKIGLQISQTTQKKIFTSAISAEPAGKSNLCNLWLT
jgi:hypothetical protein